MVSVVRDMEEILLRRGVIVSDLAKRSRGLYSDGKPLALKIPRSSWSFLLVSVPLSWAIAVLVFVTLPVNSSGRALITVIVYWSAAVFTLAAVGQAAQGAEGKLRLFWGLLWTGLLAEFCGYLFWQTIGRVSFLPLGVAPQDVAYFFSYSLIFAALIYLVALNTRGVAPLCPLDVLGVMVPAGLLVWYFVLGPAFASGAYPEGFRQVVVNLYGPVTDAGFLFLCLLTLTGGSRPPFVRWLAGGFAIFLVGDLLCAQGDPFGIYEAGRWPELFWALGIATFGLAALRASSNYPSRSSVGPPQEIRPWKAFVFWLGPLSPALQYAFLLSWATLHPPVPLYITWAGVALVLYFALRTSVLHYVGYGLRRQGEKEARKEEQRRISGELHDTLKQNVYGAALLLDSYKEAREKWGAAEAERILDGAIAASREASHRVSRSIEELCTRCEESDSDVAGLLRGMLGDMSRHFGIHTHEDLSADFCLLDVSERATAYRIASEALWNAAKHSGAGNIWLESRHIGSIFLVKVRDDGQGFSTEDSTLGFGISLMEERAEEAGGVLDVISKPNVGTTVQVRFVL